MKRAHFGQGLVKSQKENSSLNQTLSNNHQSEGTKLPSIYQNKYFQAEHEKIKAILRIRPLMQFELKRNDKKCLQVIDEHCV